MPRSWIAVLVVVGTMGAHPSVTRAQDEEPTLTDDDEVDAGDDAEEADVPTFRALATTAPAPAPPLPAATSEFDFPIGALRAVPRRSAEALLTLAPGLFLLNHSGAYHASSVMLRGFDAGEGRDLEVLVGGVPINEPSNAHGHGYSDTHFVIPELVHSIRVTEGPFAPAQSDYAIAGTAEYQLGVTQRGLRAQGEIGSFGSRRLLLAWAPVDAARGTFVGFDVRDANGFGVNRAATSVALNAGYEHVLSRELRVSLLGFGHFAQFGSAGVVREDDVAARRLPCAPSEDAQRFCTADPSQGGATSRALLAATITWARPGTLLEQTFWGGWRHLRVRENFTGFLLDPRGDGLDEQYDTGNGGLRGRYRIETRAFDDLAQQIELGWIARHDSGTTRAWRVRASDGVPYLAAFDDEIHITHVGAHVGADLRFAEWIALRAGLRVDGFAFSTVDHAEPDRDREGERLPVRATDAMGVSFQPRGTLRIRIVPGLEWQTSGGVGTRSSDAVALSDGELAPFARALATETGLALHLADGATGGVLARAGTEGEHAQRADGRSRSGRADGGSTWDLDARIAAFHTHVDRDYVFDPDRVRNVFAGASSRLGALAFARVRVGRWLDVAASVAWTEAFLLPEGAEWQDFTSDERLPYVPRWVGRLDATLQHGFVVGGETIVIGGALGVGVLGERPLPLGASAPPVGLVDVAARARWRLIEVGLQIQNLLDVRWSQNVFRYASSFDPAETPSRVPALHSSAGAPISALVTLAVLIDETAPLRGPEGIDP